jgi:hypothetical protein
MKDIPMMMLFTRLMLSKPIGEQMQFARQRVTLSQVVFLEAA